MWQSSSSRCQCPQWRWYRHCSRGCRVVGLSSKVPVALLPRLDIGGLALPLSWDWPCNRLTSRDELKLKGIFSLYHFHILNPCWIQYPPQGSRITNLIRLFDIPCWIFIFLTYLAITKTYQLLEYIAEKMGYCSVTEETIPFIPFG